MAAKPLFSLTPDLKQPLRGALERLAERCPPTEARVTNVDQAADGTLKTVVSFRDGRDVEMVLIPNRDRTTLCISSQVGCARGCRFCLTATMGLKSNLDAGEIVAQLFIAIGLSRARSLPRLKNLVLMGMGEPLDNFANVSAALSLITDEAGLGIGHRHVTVSTVAPTPAAVRRAASLPAHLAWSLHAASDELRRTLVPTARHTVFSLRDAFAEVLAEKRAPLFVEVTLIDHLNDRLPDADAIAALFTGFPSEVRVNLLPMNPIGTAWQPSPPDRVAAFRDRLRALGLRALVRRARGADRRAACGQLVLGAP